MDKYTLLKIDLPKWPACVIWGDKVSEKQAAEIILKTDHNFPDFTYGSNYHNIDRELNALTGLSHGWDFEGDNIERWKVLDEFKAELGVLDLSYLTNDRISSSYICGLNGWCNWNGDIFQNNKNIGKWPSVASVWVEWQTIANAFPFLSLTCTLYSGEQCEEGTEALVSYTVSDGVAKVVEPIESVPVVDNTNYAGIFAGPRGSIVYPDFLREKMELVYGKVPQIGEKTA